MGKQYKLIHSSFHTTMHNNVTDSRSKQLKLMGSDKPCKYIHTKELTSLKRVKDMDRRKDKD